MKLPFKWNKVEKIKKNWNSRDDRKVIERILERDPELEKALLDQMQAVDWLEQHQSLLMPRQDFLDESHTQLMSNLKAELNPRQQMKRRVVSRMRYVRMAAEAAILLLFCMLLLNVTQHTILLAQRSLPGEFLYPLKRMSESTRLVFTFGAVSDAHLHMYYTQQRTLELQELLLEGNYDRASTAVENLQVQFNRTEQVLSSVADRDPQMAQDMQHQLHDSLQEQALVLGLLVERLPRDLRSGVEQVMQTEVR